MRLVEEDEVAAFRNSGQFDERWYLQEYPDVALTQIDPAEHFLWIGKRLGRRPRPSNASANAAGATAGHRSAGESARLRQRARLIAAHHDILDELGRACEAMRGAVPPAPPARRSLAERLRGVRSLPRNVPFDRSWVRQQVPAADTITPAKLISDPRFRHVDPHPLFSTSYYLERNPDVAGAGISPFMHYLEHGWREGRDPHRYFANDWYLQRNPDVLAAGTNPLVHYLDHGWKEGRRPNPVFDPLEYLRRYPDVQAAGIEPLTHFVTFGLAEDREVPFQGLERDWRTLVDHDGSKSLMDHLLSGSVSLASRAPVAERVDGGAWPPVPLNEFWIPQPLRDIVVERRWEHSIPLYTYLYSVIDAYSEMPEEFAVSADCEMLMERARTLSGAATSAVEEPSASVIIPVYNNFLDTLLCIVSLLETQPRASFEIIVADDCSTDATARLIPEIGGIVRHVRHTENHGFLGNSNIAAKHARGRAIVLLNNDTLVLPGWLDELLAPLEREDVGFVGSKLISWDGRLQEAGGIFWKDGSAWNFGRNQNALEPEFNYLKDVDYCSGASIAIPRPQWESLGGFDPAYAPAYCEDSDLAFRVRAAGLRTVYAPHSELIHHEGRSHGRDTSSGIKAYQVVNQERLYARWRDVLERENFPNGENVLEARDRSARKRHMLVIDHYVPQFDRDAGSRTMSQFLEALVKQGWAVTFWPENLYHDPKYTAVFQNMGVEVTYGHRFAGKFADFLRDRTGFYDAVLLSRPHVAIRFLDDVKTLTDARVLYYGHDVHFARMSAQQAIAGSVSDEDIESMRALELGICDRSDVVLYPSEDEARLIAPLVAPSVRVRPIPAYYFSDAELQDGADALAEIQPLSDAPAQLLFVGGFAHGPNGDGIEWFAREVAPILRRDGFDFEVHIAGSNPTAQVWDLEAEDTHVLGFVSDDELRALYRKASIVIAPLRFGAGVKGKVVEAMARGVPIATTTVGAQGLAGAEDFLFIGDTAEEFASAVRSATDVEAARAKAAKALDFIRRHHSQSAMMAVFDDVLPHQHHASGAA